MDVNGTIFHKQGHSPKPRERGAPGSKSSRGRIAFYHTLPSCSQLHAQLCGKNRDHLSTWGERVGASELWEEF